MDVGMSQQVMEQSSCTEDRIQHLLERCLDHLDLNSPDKHLWTAGLCISRWCLEELVKRDPHNFLILLQKILRKTEEVLEQSQHELVVPLTILFSSALLRIPHMAPECNMLLEAYQLFYRFLSWPEPCSSACKRLLNIIQQELRAPGISFQRLLRAEQDIPHDSARSKSIMVLLVNPDEDIPPEVQLASEQLSKACSSTRDVEITLILHSFQAVLGAKYNLQAVQTALEEKPTEEVQELLKVITDRMETAASAGDHRTAREGLIQSMEEIGGSLAAPAAKTDQTKRDFETFGLTPPRCHMCLWEEDSFDFLTGILASDYWPDSPVESFLKATAADEEDHINTSMDEEDEMDSIRVEVQSHRISSASSSSRDSMLSSHSLSSSWSVPSGSSEVESDCGEDPPEDLDQRSQPEPRKKPKKKSKSLLGIERFALLFKTPLSPSTTRRVQSMGFYEINKDALRSGLQLKAHKTLIRQTRHSPTPPTEPLSPQRNLCVRRRPILSCSEDILPKVPTLVKVVVFGGDREVGRLARAYCDLQQKESKCPLLTKMCKLQFYFVPTKRRTDRHSETPFSKPTASAESDVPAGEGSSLDISKMLGVMDPWYDRNVFSLLSLSSEVLCQVIQVAPKEDGVSRNNTEHLVLLADLVLYYCRQAEEQVLMQLYQAELTLAGGERRREVFIHSLELGHTAGTRAVKSMGAASKRFGIDEEREAVPLTLSVAYNKVAVSGRSQRVHKEMVCTSINLFKCRQEADLLGLKDGLHMTTTEVLKRQCSKSKKSLNQLICSSKSGKVDNVQIMAGNDGATFTVCLDQDEKKFLQGVIRCEVSLCCKPGAGSDWTSYKPLPGQVQPVDPTYCSLLCLPITCFSASMTHTHCMPMS